MLDPSGKNVYQDFLNLGIAREAARYADIYEIQAQGSDRKNPPYETKHTLAHYFFYMLLLPMLI